MCVFTCSLKEKDFREKKTKETQMKRSYLNDKEVIDENIVKDP